mgnify:CR=1 FL=1
MGSVWSVRTRSRSIAPMDVTVYYPDGSERLCPRARCINRWTIHSLLCPPEIPTTFRGHHEFRLTKRTRIKGKGAGKGTMYLLCDVPELASAFQHPWLQRNEHVRIEGTPVWGPVLCLQARGGVR